jgi:hypothetical protein
METDRETLSDEDIEGIGGAAGLDPTADADDTDSTDADADDSDGTDADADDPS